MRFLLRPSINWLFAFIAFIAITLVLEHLGAASPVVSFSAAFSIVPIARLIVLSTEQVAHRTGHAIGGPVCGDGHSNWFKGGQMLTLYAIIALILCVISDAVPPPSAPGPLVQRPQCPPRRPNPGSDSSTRSSASARSSSGSSWC